MKKQLRFIGCFLMIFAIVLLTACKDNTADDGINSNTQNSTASQYDGSQTESGSDSSDDTDSVSSSTAQDGSSALNGTSSNTQSGSGTGTGSKAADTSSSVNTSSANLHTHSYSSKKVDATCTTDGYTLKTCACGHSEKTNTVAALGHNWGSWTTVNAATATSTGLQRRTCTRCGKTEEKVLEKLTQTAGDLQLEILRLVNEERAKQGLNALQYYYAGQSAADIRATEIDYVFSHTRPDGTSCFTALDEADINYRGAGENIAKGYPTAEDVMNGWMNSSGHKANILNESFTHIIVGVNGKCWVQLFLTL